MSPRIDRFRARRGLALVPALVALVVVGLLGAAIVRQAMTQRRAVRDEQARAQADWLVESGLALGAARLDADPAYDGETWSIPAASDALGGRPATVVVAVEPVPDRPRRRRVRATATLQAGDPGDDAGRVKQSGDLIHERPAESPNGAP